MDRLESLHVGLREFRVDEMLTFDPLRTALLDVGSAVGHFLRVEDGLLVVAVPNIRSLGERIKLFLENVGLRRGEWASPPRSTGPRSRGCRS